jgi:hypothetical protein
MASSIPSESEPMSLEVTSEGRPKKTSGAPRASPLLPTMAARRYDRHTDYCACCGCEPPATTVTPPTYDRHTVTPTAGRVLIIYTGGTMGMTQQADGSLAPTRGYLPRCRAGTQRWHTALAHSAGAQRCTLAHPRSNRRALLTDPVARLTAA